MDAFVTALLMTADEHQAKADHARSMMDPAAERTRGEIGDMFRALQREMNEGWRKEIEENEGLAEVYRGFAEGIVMAQQIQAQREAAEQAQQAWMQQFFPNAEAAVAYMDFYLGRG